MATASKATIDELNADLDARRESPSLVAQDYGYFAHVALRTREPRPDERFLRVGSIPYEGRSFNFRDRVHEEGVSCYRIEEDKCAASPFSPGYEGGAETYWITGRVLQISTDGETWKDLCGADGEPLLHAARYVSRTRKAPKDFA